MNQRNVWNKIANSWNNFRQKPLKGIDEFSSSIKGKTLFVGCGNGRNFKAFKQNEIIGIDFSYDMLINAINMCKKNKINAKLVMSNESLPFKSNYFDSVVSLSSLHCMKKRKEAINEMYRVLKYDGLILISVWNRWQWRFFPKNLISSNFYIPWKNKNFLIKRYYHLYSLSELKKELKNFKIEKEKITNGNIFVLGRKS